MTKRDVIGFLFKWKYSLAGYFLLVVAVATAVTYAKPKTYEARALVLIESNKAPAMRSDAVFGVEQLSVLISEIAIIRSATVLRATAEAIGVAGSPADAPPRGAIAGALAALKDWTIDVGLREPMPPLGRLIRTLEKNLVVKPLPNSSVINISFAGSDPERITRIVNTLTDRYIDHHLKVFSSAGTSEVYRLQVARLGREIETLRRRLAEYKQRAEVSAVSASLQALVRRDNELRAELATGRRELAEIQTRFAPGHTRLGLATQQVETLEEALRENQEKLQALERHEARIKEMEQQIATLERSHQEYQKQYEDERLNDLANPDVVNVRVIEYASIPARPVHSRIYYIAVAAVGGLFLSFGIVLIKEYFDHRVTDQETVAEILGIPTLGSVEQA